jgi:two-component system response regulator YesN
VWYGNALSEERQLEAPGLSPLANGILGSRMAATSGRILVVDDEPPVLEALSAALDPPYEVVTARTGHAALAAAERQSPDLALLDYLLPDVSGLVVLDALRRRFPCPAVILMTGHGSEDVSVAAFRSGVHDYLKKPIRLPDLIARVGAVLGTPRKAGELESTAGPVSSSDEGPRDGVTQRAMAYIETHLDKHLTLAQVAGEAGMSKFHFCRHFKADVGLTFREFLARRRIAKAAALLRQGSHSVGEVYMDVGFKDLSHFQPGLP